MNTQDVLKLVNAGFSKNEILALAGMEPKPEPAPEPEPVPEPAPEPKPAAPEPAPEQSQIDKLTEQVSRLTDLVHKSNLLAMQQPEVKPESAEDVIASIIFPSHKAENNK